MKANLSPSYVGKVESGEIDPSLRAFAKIAMALEMSDFEIVFLVETSALYHGAVRPEE